MKLKEWIETVDFSDLKKELRKLYEISPRRVKYVKSWFEKYWVQIEEGSRIPVVKFGYNDFYDLMQKIIVGEFWYIQRIKDGQNIKGW